MIATIANICCFIYYTVASIQTIPTIIRVIKYKESDDISLIHIWLSLISAHAWLTYILLSQQTMLVYIGTIWDHIVCLVYSIVVIKYHHKKFK